MTKKQQIQAYRNELVEIEIQEQLIERTINTIAKRKSVLIQALGDLGEAPGAVSKKSKRHFSNQELLKIKASITKKAPARA